MAGNDFIAAKQWPLLGYALKDKLHATDPA